MPITKEFYVDLDLKTATGNRDFTLVEGDTGNVIHVTLKDDGTPVDLTGCRVLAVFTKPTGSSMQDSAIEGGGVSIGGDAGNEVTISLYAASFGTGTNACELQIYSGEERNVLVTSAAFNFYCRNGIIDDDTIRATDEYPLLTSLIAQVQSIEDSVLMPTDVDFSLSATSENPVQNKAVKEALDGKAPSSHTHAPESIGAAPALQSDVTYYVATTGNDTTGDGTSGNPFATVNKALSMIPVNLNGHSAAVQIAAGEYAQGIYIFGYHGGSLTLQGTYTTANVPQVTFTSEHGESYECRACSATVTLQYFAIATNQTRGLEIVDSTCVVVAGLHLTGTNTAPNAWLLAISKSIVTSPWSSNAWRMKCTNGVQGVNVTQGTLRSFYALGGTGNSTGIVCQGGMVQTVAPAAAFAATLYSATYNGRIYAGAQSSIPNY